MCVVRHRLWTLALLLSAAVSCPGSNLGPPSPAPVSLPGDRLRESAHNCTGPVSWELTVGGNVDGSTCRGPTEFWKYDQSWQSNLEVLIANQGETAVRNPRIVVNGQRDWLTLNGIVAEATQGCYTPAEKARGIWEFVRRGMFNAFAGTDDQRQSWKVFNDYGFGFCSEMTIVLGELWQAAGLPSRMAIWKPYHTAPEVYYDGAWHVMDPSFKALLLDWDSNYPVSAAEVADDTALSRRWLAKGLAIGPDIDQEDRRQFWSSAYVWPTGVPHWAQTPADAPDWDLLPGSTMAWRWSHVGKHYSVYTSAFPELSNSDLFSNGQLSYQPDLSRAAGRLGLVEQTNLAGPDLANPGLRPADAAQSSRAVWKLALPWPMVGGRIDATVTRASTQDGIALSISRDGSSWTHLSTAAGTGTTTLSGVLDTWLSPGSLPVADREVWIRLDVTAGAGQGWSVDALSIVLDVQMNLKSLPELVLGSNTVEYRDGSAGPRHVLVTQRWIERTAWTRPEAPSLINPIGSADANSTGLTFRWAPPSSPDGIAKYQLEVAERADMKWSVSPYFERYTTQPEWTLPDDGVLNPNRPYYWRVRAMTPYGVWGPWSLPEAFRLIQPARPTNVELLPTADGTGFRLQWSPGTAGSTPVAYRLYGSNEAAFTPHDSAYLALFGVGSVASEAEYQQQAATIDPWRTIVAPANYVATIAATEAVVIGPDAIAGGNRCHWRVVAVDAQGNRSAPSDCITASAPLIASRPVATVSADAPYLYQPVLVGDFGRLATLGSGLWAYWNTMRPVWSLPTAPAGLQVDATTGQLSGTLPVGRYPVALRATVTWNGLENYVWPALPQQTAVREQSFELRALGPPAKLEFENVAAAVAAGQPFGCRVIVSDAADNGLSIPVTLTLDDPRHLAVLSGTKTVASQDGPAEFSALAIDRPGSDYHLIATGAGLEASSIAINVVPAPPSFDRATLQASAAEIGADGLQSIDLTITLQDEQGQPVTDIAAERIEIAASPATGATIVPPTGVSAADGTLRATFRTTALGPVTLSATVDGTALPTTVQVTGVPGPTSAAHSTAVVPNGMAGVATHLKIEARDAQGHLRAAGGDAVVVTVNGTHTATPAVADLGDGTYTTHYTPTVTGSDEVAITIGGSPVAGSPFPSLVAPGRTTADQTTADVPNGSAGLPTTITVQAKDSLGNLRTIGGDTVAIAIRGGHSLTLAVTDVGDGTYTASYTPTVAGTDTIAVSINGTAIDGSPFTSLVAPGPTSAAQSTVAVPDGQAGIATAITVYARDSHGNARPTGGDTVVVAVSGGNDLTVPVTDLGDGTYRASYTPTVAGTDTIAVSINGPAIAGSPFTSQVAAGPTNAARSTAEVPPGQDATPTVITVQARDAYGNQRPVGGDTVTVSVSGGNQATPTVTDRGDGTYRASYTPTVAGTDTIAISINGTAVGGSPFSSRVADGLTSPARSTAAVPDGLAGSSTTVTVRARDVDGNPRSVGNDTVVVAVTGANSATPAVTDHDDGTYTASYVPTVAGVDTVAITIGGIAIGDSPFRSTVAPGPTNAARSTATVPAGVTGEPTTILVQARDAYGNRRTSGGDAVVVAVSGANDLTAPVTDLGDGSYRASYIPTVAGTDTVAISINGSTISGSPFSSRVADSVTNAARSTATVPDGTAGEPTEIIITARDALGHRSTVGGDTVVVAVSGGHSLTLPVTDRGDGTYRASYVPTVAGADDVAISINSLALGGSPFRSVVAPGASEATRSTATVPDGRAGTATLIEIQARDAYGNRRTVGGDTVVVAVSGGTEATLPVTDQGDGSYQASYRPTVAGSDLVAISVNGPAVGGSPFTSLVAPGPASAAGSTATVPAGQAGRVTTIVVEARDAHGNRRASGGDEVVVEVSGTNLATPAVTDHGDGSYSASYTPTASGTDVLDITLNSASVGGSPYASVVAPGAADAARSVATMPATVRAGDRLTIDVSVRDSFGNPLTDDDADPLVQLTGAVNADLSLTGQGNGTYTGSLTPTATGVAQVAISLAGTPIHGSPFEVVITPGTIDPQLSTVALAPDRAAADGVAAIIATIALRDSFGNPVADVPAEQIGVGATPTGLRVQGLTATGSDGSATAALTSLLANHYVLSVQVGEVTLEARPSAVFRAVFRETLPAGKLFVGLPCLPDDPRPESVIAAIGEGQFAVWQPSSGSFVRYRVGDANPLFDITAGRGWWMDFGRSVLVDTIGEPTPLEPWTYSLSPGWNALGNPFNAALTWDPANIVVSQHGVVLGNLAQSELWSKVRPYVWFWDPAAGGYWLAMLGYGQAAVPRLNGFWIEALEPGLTLTVPPATGARQASRAASASRWAARLLAECDGATSVLTVGVDPSLTRELLIAEPPSTEGESPLKLQLAVGDRLLAGQIADGGRAQSWPLLLTSAIDGNATLSWPGLLRELPRGLMLELEDLTSGQRWLLNTTSSIRLLVTRGSQRALQLTARIGHFDRTVITSVQLRGSRGEGRSVELQVSGPASVTLTVRGLGGRMVRQLTATATAAGPLVVGWDGRDQNGRAVPRGSYLLEAVAQSDNGAMSRVVRTVTIN